MVLNVERSKYINSVIEMFTKSKLGTYSKFLNMVPTFVTYYHINQTLSRTDVGTGNIESELGERSPIRFSKILNFPLYNIPELRPDLTWDETGADVELEMNDIAALPNTIKPLPGDHFIVKFPRMKEFLFRVNKIGFNTVQSNDYYKLDVDIKAIGDNLEATRMKGQIVDTYYSVFENIGTDDRWLIKSTDADYLNGLANLYHTLKEWYKGAFYVRNLNSFTIQTPRFSETGRQIFRYDPYLEHFINESMIYYQENSEESLYLTPNAILQDNFDLTFQMTLYDAVLKRKVELLRPYCYLVTHVITMPTSIYNRMHYFGECAWLYCYKKKIPSHNQCACECGCGTGEKWYDLDPMPRCTPTWTLSDGQEYFSSEFLQMILNKHIDTEDYFELIIFNFLHGIKMKYDRTEIMDALDQDFHCFYYLPIIIYIIKCEFEAYFATENDVDL